MWKMLLDMFALLVVWNLRIQKYDDIVWVQSVYVSQLPIYGISEIHQMFILCCLIWVQHKQIKFYTLMRIRHPYHMS